MTKFAATIRSGAGRAIRLGAAVWSTIFASISLALAAPPPFAPAAPATAGGKRYVYQYFLVALCIALGLLLLAQPRKREESVESRTDRAFGD
jgi:hypothetical protein